VYELWRGTSRTIPNRYFPLENPQDFPSRRGQAMAYSIHEKAARLVSL